MFAIYSINVEYIVRLRAILIAYSYILGYNLHSANIFSSRELIHPMYLHAYKIEIHLAH